MKKRTLLKTLMATALVCASVTFAGEGVAVKGNTKSKIYHKPACTHYTAQTCTAEFKSEAEAKAAGYKPCKKCCKEEKPAEPK